MAENEEVLAQTHALLAGDSVRLSIPPAGVWLLDNFFLIEEQIQLARMHLPRRYSRELPRLSLGRSTGLPRVYVIVQDLISHVDGLVDEQNLRTSIAAYQRATPLRLGELWAIPIMLRLALIENLRRIATRIGADRRDRALADFWAARMRRTAERDPKNIVLDIADMARADISMSCACIAELVRELQSHSPALSIALTWIEQRLTEQGQTIERQVQLDSQQQSTNHIAIRNSITSLRFLTSMDWKAFVEAMSRVESILRADPCGAYPKMDFTTRDMYRHAVERIAKRARATEESVATQVVALAASAEAGSRTSHIGAYLIDGHQAVLERAAGMRKTVRDTLTRAASRAPLLLYLGSGVAATAGFTALAVWGANAAGGVLLWAIGILAAVASSQAAIALVNWLATMVVPPRLLARMDFSAGIPPDARTIVAVPAMLAGERTVAALIDKMEVCYLSNRAENLYFGLVTDFEDAPTETTPEDVALLYMVRDGIRRLNASYAGLGRQPFLLFHRSREWNPRQNCWMGYERKRGKLEALNQCLRDPTTPGFLVEGDQSILAGVKYVITLDTDTELPRDSARHLIEAMAHPLNTPVLDQVHRRVIDGYAILQPRVVSSLPAIDTSWYARIFGSDSGIDPYTRAVSDVYQDVFGEGSFIGKGIYEVDAFTRVLAERLPENRILSHDLLEGTYCRSGLISDVQLVDEFPQRYSADHARRQRWIRGDWQIAAWLGRRVPGFRGGATQNPISRLSQWKILDNIRRSIVPPSMLLLIVVSWLFVTPAWLGLAVVLAVLLAPALPGAVFKAVRIPPRFPLYAHAQSVMEFVGLQVVQTLFAIAVLPHEAFSNLDAIVRTWWRLRASRRNLLQWTASGGRASGCGLWAHARLMGAAPVFAFLTGSVFVVSGHPIPWLVLGLWFCSPILAWWMGRPLVPRPAHISNAQHDFLRKIARKTWRYFETFAGADNNWLPADNYQEEPVEAVAHRTSPTNVGLMLLSNLGAYDLGYVTAGQLIERTRKSFTSMASLARHRGHFLNWYDTQTLQPLTPQYVSTVDSGNLAGYLLTLRTGLLEVRRQPIVHGNSSEGLLATLGVAREFAAAGSEIDQRLRVIDSTLREFQRIPTGLTSTLQLYHDVIAGVQQARALVDPSAGSEGGWWLRALEDQCAALRDELLHLAPWLGVEPAGIPPDLWRALDSGCILEAVSVLGEGQSPPIDGAGVGSSAEPPQLAGIERLMCMASARARERIETLEALAAQCREFADQDYEFLYDTSRHLLTIGYDVAKRRRDEGFYDLLASESRLGSFVGIAQGKLPLEHWFRLGRLVAMSHGKAMLLSWGGSMFEFLMPRLVMPGYDQTLLGQTCTAIVDRQIDYGGQRGVPWGISESAENSTDAGLNYQYRSFGVPGLGFKRDLAADLVIAPYASVLALAVRPQQACVNMERLAADGYEGRYGFYEAVDFTPSRMTADRDPALIRSFMAHHQGMSFVSLVNFLADNPMPRRFESDPLFRTTTLLLQERVPRASPFQLQPSDGLAGRAVPAGPEDRPRIFTTPHTTMPEVHLLSNGRYHVMVTAAGAGYSRWRDLAVTRWNDDTTMDNAGTFVYVNDLSIGRQWSVAFQPTCVESRTYEAIFPQARAEFRRRDGGLDSYTEIAVSPEDDIEYRRITLSNFTGKSRTIELTSYAEVVLAPPAADAAHPSFSNLFVQTHILKERHAILCSRRPRSPGEACPWMLHLFTVRGLQQYEISYETDRRAFVGRGRTTRNPLAMATAGPLGGADGSVLDPVVAIRCRLTLGVGETVTVGFVSGVAETRQQADMLIDKYQDSKLADRVFDLAIIHGKIVLRQLNATESDAQLYGILASSILYANRHRRASPSLLVRNTRGQSHLWAYSISGDLPIVLLRIGDPSKIELVVKLIQAHAYWRLKGLAVDLVIWNEERTGYRQVFNDQIVGLIAAGPEASLYDKTGGVFVRHPDQMSDEDQVLMLAAARVVFTDTGGTLPEQVMREIRSEPPVPAFVASRSARAFSSPQSFEQHNLLFPNGWGGFTQDGREYIIQLKPGRPTPMPWSNVVANKQFGTVISQGGGYTWFENAHEFRLTPWYNDAVSDRSGEAIYLRDEDSGRFWSATPQPSPGEGEYLNRHGFGYSVFEYSQYRLKSELWVFVDTDAPVKFWLMKVRNDSESARRFSATGFLELVLGENRSKTQMHVRTGVDSKTGAILASNPFNTEFPGRVVFFDASETQRSISGDRTEFIGRNGSPCDPAALHRVRLSGKVGVGLDACAAIQVYVELSPGQEKEIVFTLGAGRDIEDARNRVHAFCSVQSAYAARDRVWHYWSHTLGAVNVETPDRALDLLANGWLLYQSMAARLWARSGYYQSGGAYGFRDQLQDVMALVHAEPRLIREHLLLCASRQFLQGDVQHWWHPPGGRGVRTTISDDYLWLPFVTSEYVARTGDTGILDEVVHFLDSRPLGPAEESLYDLPTRAHEKTTLYEHCTRAILHGLRFGQRGLPLMGSGDWNDGMNLVGVKGVGESVWLAFFLHAVLKQFAEVARSRGDTAFADRCVEEAERLRRNIETEAWDGAWYRRAFFDDGAVLGSSRSDECRIDGTVQSWSVLFGAGSVERSTQAMLSLTQQLVDSPHGLIKLLDPPFDTSAQEPGYIKGYVPGVRENGGQYTHAAIWAVMALAKLGQSRRAHELLSMINPINHGSTPESIGRYLVEPYVMAADVYASEPHAGRGGWTWYTGSASWMYRLIVESVLGVRLEVDKLVFNPCIPAEWESLKIHYRYRETVYHCSFHQVVQGGVMRVIVDGTVQDDRSVPLVDDRQEHFVEIVMGAATGVGRHSPPE